MSIWAENKIAVMVNAPDEEKAFMIETAVCQKLDKNSNYTMLERTQEFLDMAVTEQVYQTSGEVAESHIVEYGQHWGANYVLAITAKESNGTLRIVGKLIDIRTGRRLNTANSFRKINNENDLIFLISTFAANVERDLRNKL